MAQLYNVRKFDNRFDADALVAFIRERFPSDASLAANLTGDDWWGSNTFDVHFYAHPSEYSIPHPVRRMQVFIYPYDGETTDTSTLIGSATLCFPVVCEAKELY